MFTIFFRNLFKEKKFVLFGIFVENYFVSIEILNFVVKIWRNE